VIGLLAGRVADSAQVEVLADVPILRHKVPGHTSNLHTKINPAAFHGIVKICESVTRIARSVASNDQLAPAAHEFVHCQVLEVTSVRQVDIFTVIARRTEEFPQKAQETQIRAASYPLLFPWIRSEERRVGKECRSRWSLDHLKEQNNQSIERLERSQ